MSLSMRFRLKCLTADGALSRKQDVPPAMCIQCGRTVRAHDPEILQAIVGCHPVDVIEDERHPAAVPHLILAAELASALLELFRVETLLEGLAAVARLRDEHFLKRQ